MSPFCVYCGQEIKDNPPVIISSDTIVREWGFNNDRKQVLKIICDENDKMVKKQITILAPYCQEHLSIPPFLKFYKHILPWGAIFIAIGVIISVINGIYIPSRAVFPTIMLAIIGSGFTLGISYLIYLGISILLEKKFDFPVSLKGHLGLFLSIQEDIGTPGVGPVLDWLQLEFTNPAIAQKFLDKYPEATSEDVTLYTKADYDAEHDEFTQLFKGDYGCFLLPAGLVMLGFSYVMGLVFVKFEIPTPWFVSLTQIFGVISSAFGVLVLIYQLVKFTIDKVRNPDNSVASDS